MSWLKKLLKSIAAKKEAERIAKEMAEKPVITITVPQVEAKKNTLYIVSSDQMKAGEKFVIYVYLSNVDDVDGFQFDMIATGFKLLSETAELSRDAQHQLSCINKSDDLIRVLVYDFDPCYIINGNKNKIESWTRNPDAIFEGNEGIVFSVEAIAPSIPGKYKIDFTGTTKVVSTKLKHNSSTVVTNVVNVLNKLIPKEVVVY